MKLTILAIILLAIMIVSLSMAIKSEQPLSTQEVGIAPPSPLAEARADSKSFYCYDKATDMYEYFTGQGYDVTPVYGYLMGVHAWVIVHYPDGELAYDNWIPKDAEIFYTSAIRVDDYDDWLYLVSLWREGKSAAWVNGELIRNGD